MPYAKSMGIAALSAILPMTVAVSPGSAAAAASEHSPPVAALDARIDRIIVKLRQPLAVSGALARAPRRFALAAVAAQADSHGVPAAPLAQAAASADRPAARRALLKTVVERVMHGGQEGSGSSLAWPRTRRDAHSVSYTLEISGSAHVVGLAASLDGADAAALAQRLGRQPEIEYAEPDYRLRAHLEPSDPLYVQQWSYGAAPAGAANVAMAWNVTTGSAHVVTAVIDSGIRPHPDLAAKVLTGYDFVSEPFSGNDGDGRDADASDPGNWATIEDSLQCDGTLDWVADSHWHGTHVAGTIGAMANNGVGGVGVSWQGGIVPVRALGRCGGLKSDIIDAIRWAAGLPVPGVPSNPYPAKVINASFGIDLPCTQAMQEAIDDVIARGASVVASAGNSGGELSEPANCRGVIAVAAVDREGERAPFSSRGPRVDIGAPGVAILSTANAGKTVPAEDNYLSYDGTSMAAPHVSGTIALMRAANPSLTPAAIRSALSASARPYPPASSCAATAAGNGSVCGSGILDAGRALEASVAH
jgi:serine protease